MLSPATGNRVIGFLRAIPAVITIHTEIAPGEAADSGIVRQACNKILQVDASVTRQHITAIGKAVNDNSAAGFRQTIDHGQNVILMGVNSARREQTDNMRCPAGLLQRAGQFLERRMCL